MISLTDFVDFVSSSGSPKLTKVRTVKARDDYHPSRDFWRRLREGIVQFHKEGERDKKQLDLIVKSQTDQKKRTAYPQAIRRYTKVLGRKEAIWFDPPRKTWTSHGLDVRTNRELGLFLGGERLVIKLYLKTDPLCRRRVDLIVSLMQNVLSRKRDSATLFSILDAQRGKIFFCQTTLSYDGVRANCADFSSAPTLGTMHFTAVVRLSRWHMQVNRRGYYEDCFIVVAADLCRRLACRTR